MWWFIFAVTVVLGIAGSAIFMYKNNQAKVDTVLTKGQDIVDKLK